MSSSNESAGARAAKRLIVMLSGVACLACFGPFRVVVPSPSPNYPATRERSSITMSIDVRGVPSGEVCSRASGSRDVCLSKLDSAFYAGLKPMVDRFFVHNQTQSDLYARIDLVEYFVEPAAVTTGGSAVAVRLGMRWRFTIADNKGKAIAQLAATSVTSRSASGEADLQAVALSLVELVLENIGTGLNKLPPELIEPASSPPRTTQEI